MISKTKPKSTRRKLRVRSLHDDSDNGYVPGTMAERIEMVWPLTVTAWAFKGEAVGESRLPRHIVHIQRRKS